jgi:hypothetical protein
MKAHQTWKSKNFKHNRQPCSSDRLHALLARELNYDSPPRTRQVPRKWMLGLVIFVVAVATTAKVTSGGKFEFFGNVPFQTNAETLRNTVEHQRHIQVAELAMFNLEQMGPLVPGKLSVANLGAALYRHDSLADRMWKPSDTSLARPQNFRPTRMALSPPARREVEFWRVVVQSNDPVLYRSYLRHYPTGTFALIAKSRSEQPKKSARVTASNRTKRSTPSDEIPKPIAPGSPDGRCNSQKDPCALAKPAQKDCLAANAAICVKRNYRPMERSTATMEAQIYRR